MALPKREYYYLQEVVQKLEITEFDLQYYLSHGDILGCAWVNRTMFMQEHIDAFKKGYVAAGTYSYEGYATLNPNDCREIFTAGMIYAHKFFVDYPETRIILPTDQPGILIRRSSLMVSMWDFEFFAEQYCSSNENEKNNGGRPTLMPKIIEEHIRRIEANEACKNRTQEALVLRQWADLNFKNYPIPKQKTIRNELMKRDNKKPSEAPHATA